jgi:hypothetical protein
MLGLATGVAYTNHSQPLGIKFHVWLRHMLGRLSQFRTAYFKEKAIV